MAAFEVIYEHALGIRINGEFWIDGSFLTRKIEPGDVDLILVTPARFYDDGTQEQQKFLDWLINTEDDPRKSFRCHTDIVLAYDPDHAEYGRYRDIANHWQNNVYGYSVTTREPKGIVVVSLTGDEAV
ncbi:MAG: hypothetical protein M3Y07_04605 [Acidobacteriota bacterium]|nr:hypothetical protein [Acidobacteriota bacterium]